MKIYSDELNDIPEEILFKKQKESQKLILIKTWKK